MQEDKKLSQFMGILEAELTRIIAEIVEVDPSTAKAPDILPADFDLSKFSDDKEIMRAEIMDYLTEPLASHPINLHLAPQMFFPQPFPPMEETTTCRIEHPTRIELIFIVDGYYWELGEPEAAKVFAGSLYDPWNTGSKEDLTLLMQ